MKKPFSKLQSVSFAMLLVTLAFMALLTYYSLPNFQNQMLAFLCGLGLSLFFYIAGWVTSTLTEKTRALPLYAPALLIAVSGFKCILPLLMAAGILAIIPVTYFLKWILKRKTDTARKSQQSRITTTPQ